MGIDISQQVSGQNSGVTHDPACVEGSQVPTDFDVRPDTCGLTFVSYVKVNQHYEQSCNPVGWGKQLHVHKGTRCTVVLQPTLKANLR